MSITLHQFASSHFNEKARWALAYKGVAHQRESYLPGPHMSAMRKLSGQTATPVMDYEGEIISGSAAIIDKLEQAHPEPALYPQDPQQRRQALEDQARFDAQLGPAVRTVVFGAMLPTIGYAAQIFGREHSGLKKTLYRAMLPMLKGLIAKGNSADTPEKIAAAEQVLQAFLSEFDERLGNGQEYLVGDRFSVADLAAASLLAPIVSLSHPDMVRPPPVPEAMQRLVANFSARRATQWAHTIYERHRP